MLGATAGGAVRLTDGPGRLVVGQRFSANMRRDDASQSIFAARLKSILAHTMPTWDDDRRGKARAERAALVRHYETMGNPKRNGR